MSAYLIADVEVTDSVAYEDYRKQVPGIIAQYGGRYLVRGGALEVMEGERPPRRCVVLEFPSMAQLKAFYHSPEYAPLLAARGRAAQSNLFLVEGV